MKMPKFFKKKGFDALSLVRREPRGADPDRKWFAADPETIYPAVIARIQEALETGEYPSELIQKGENPTGVASAYLAAAKALPDQAWRLAGLRREDVFKPNEISLRREALELARLWFTQALRTAAGEPIGLHILKGNGIYRL